MWLLRLTPPRCWIGFGVEGLGFSALRSHRPGQTVRFPADIEVASD
jgi:hypothetical protein